MTVSFILSIIIIYLCAMLAMAFFTLLERKILGYMQLRKGPNKVGIMGLLQPFADALKLFTKEHVKPSHANMSPFFIAPATALLLTLMMWSLYPLQYMSFFMPLGILFFLCISSSNVYTLLAAGWASNSKYSLIGALRAIAQTISYEVSMVFILLPLPIISMSMDLSSKFPKFLSAMCLLMPFSLFLWTTTMLAETNRTPFDLAEAESELVSGFNTEYSSRSFALIFMAEYANILIISMISASLFALMSPASPLFSTLSLTLTCASMGAFFIWARGTFPRMRYDRLMSLSWKSLLPFSLINMWFITTLFPFF